MEKGHRIEEPGVKINTVNDKNEEIQETQTNMLFANFPLQLILCFSYSARISVKDADWLRQRIVEVGGLQMLATLETGDET